MSAPSLHPGHPLAPKFWRFETSGVLKPAVEAYLEGKPPSISEITSLRAYLRQWIFSPVWDENPYVGAGNELQGLRDAIDSLTNRAQIETWLRKASDIGIDPL